VLTGLGLYGAMLLVGAVSGRPAGRRRAARNARRLERLERRLHVHVEPAAQRLVLSRERLVAGLNVAYVVANIVLTAGRPIVLYRRRDPAFAANRNACAAVILASQVGFLWFPTDPPRTLPHLVDTVKDVSGVDLDSGLIARLYNPRAAMPSIHVAFAVVTSASFRRSSTSRALRTLALAYPPAVAAIVVATANHLIVDVVAGAAVGLAAVEAARRMEVAAGPSPGTPALRHDRRCVDGT
jgi:membrane-associated phospholipid phosphatase